MQLAISMDGWISSSGRSAPLIATSRNRGTALTVTLGDYIDRGPQSRGVMERLSVNPFSTPDVALKGNHEALLEAFLADPRRLALAQVGRSGNDRLVRCAGPAINARPQLRRSRRPIA